MVDKNKQGTEPADLESIEALKEKVGITDSVFEALKIANDWASGLTLSESEFRANYDRWLKAPVSGRR